MNITPYNHLPSPTNLFSYKNFVFSIPSLSEEDERVLLHDFKIKNCLVSAQKLIMSQLKLVVKIADQYKGYGLPQEDLIQEGNIGLMKAVKNFDLSYKVRLYTYALIWVKAEIQNFIIKNWKIVKLSTSKNLRKLFFSIRDLQKKMIDSGINRDSLPSLAAANLNVSEDDAKLVSSYMSSEFIDINNSDDDSPLELPYNNTPENILMESFDKERVDEMVMLAFNSLSEREKFIISKKFYSEEKATNKELSELLSISSERVRQIEESALKKIKAYLNNNKITREIALFD